MPKAIRFHQPGGPEVLMWEEVTVGKPGSDLIAMAKDLFTVVLSGAVKIEINQTYPLRDAAQAHRDLESRKTVGSTVLIV